MNKNVHLSVEELESRCNPSLVSILHTAPVQFPDGTSEIAVANGNEIDAVHLDANGNSLSQVSVLQNWNGTDGIAISLGATPTELDAWYVRNGEFQIERISQDEGATFGPEVIGYDFGSPAIHVRNAGVTLGSSNGVSVITPINHVGLYLVADDNSFITIILPTDSNDAALLNSHYVVAASVQWDAVNSNYFVVWQTTLGVYSQRYDTNGKIIADAVVALDLTQPPPVVNPNPPAVTQVPITTINSLQESTTVQIVTPVQTNDPITINVAWIQQGQAFAAYLQSFDKGMTWAANGLAVPSNLQNPVMFLTQGNF